MAKTLLGNLGFNGTAAVEQLKTDLAEKIAARDSTMAALESARSVDEVQTKAQIASLEDSIHKVNSEIVDRLADGKNPGDLRTRKAELVQRIAAQRGRMAEHQQLVQLEEAAATARKELAAAVRERMKPFADAVAVEQMEMARQIDAISTEWDTFLVAMDRLCGQAMSIRPPLHKGEGLSSKIISQLGETVEALATALKGSTADFAMREDNERRQRSMEKAGAVV